MTAKSPPKILLVEDNHADVYLFGSALRKEGIACELLQFQSCIEALRHLRETRTSAPPDLIALDLHLPGIDGHEALRQLRHLVGGVPILVLSGAPPEYVAGLDLSGTNAFVHKSLDVNAYIEAVGQAVRDALGGAPQQGK